MFGRADAFSVRLQGQGLPKALADVVRWSRRWLALINQRTHRASDHGAA